MGLAHSFLIILFFWFAIDGIRPESEGEGEMLSEHHQLKRSAAKNPCDVGNIRNRSKECKMFEWSQMNGRKDALDSAGAKYFRKPKAIFASRLSIASTTPKLRKEYRCLTDTERNKLHAAFQALKNTEFVGNQSVYDVYALNHNFQHAPEAHWGPAFCPWHREFIHRLEQELQKLYPENMLPYWDNRLERRLKGNVKYSTLFSEDMMGNGEGYVTTGFAKGWKIVNADCSKLYKTLYRNVSTDLKLLFPENAEVKVKVSTFQQMCTPWNGAFESMHGGPHDFIGGLMTYIACSPNDPIFFLHHCFVDKLFEAFKNYSSVNHFELEYPNISKKNLLFGFDATKYNFSKTQGATHPMLPFLSMVNEYGLLSDSYTKIFYQYDTSPGDIVCKEDSDCCKSDYFWCDDKVTKKCIPKVVEGGLCEKSFPDKACCCKKGAPWNNNGKCQCSQ